MSRLAKLQQKMEDFRLAGIRPAAKRHIKDMAVAGQEPNGDEVASRIIDSDGWRKIEKMNLGLTRLDVTMVAHEEVRKYQAGEMKEEKQPRWFRRMVDKVAKKGD
jgi:hypothetical protein